MDFDLFIDSCWCSSIFIESIDFATSSMFSGSAVAVAQLTLMEMAYAMMSTLVWAHTMLWALAMALARATRMTTAFVTKMMWLVALTLELWIMLLVLLWTTAVVNLTCLPLAHPMWTKTVWLACRTYCSSCLHSVRRVIERTWNRPYEKARHLPGFLLEVWSGFEPL